MQLAESAVEVLASCYKAPSVNQRSLAIVDGNVKLQILIHAVSKTEVGRITKITSNNVDFEKSVVRELIKLGVAATRKNIKVTVEKFASVTFPTGSPTPSPTPVAESKTEMAVWLIVGLLSLAALVMFCCFHCQKTSHAVAFNDTSKRQGSSAQEGNQEANSVRYGQVENSLAASNEA
jgi:hypothetical protein